MKQKVLITGINGFIGSHIAERLIQEGFDISGVSVEKNCRVSGVTYHSADISDGLAIKTIFNIEKPDYVIHLAAIVHKKSLISSYDDFYKINFQSSENIFKLCAEHDVKKVMFSSTVEVYNMAKSDFITEESEVKPVTDYGKTKILAEDALFKIAETNNMAYAIMRFAPVYGKEFTLNIDRRIYLRKGKYLYYFKNGNYFFHMCSVYNITDFITAFIKNKNESGIFNISDTKHINIKMLIDREQKRTKSIVIRLPYYLTFIAIKMIETIFKVFGKKSIISIHNFKKLFQSIIFDNQKARSVVGEFNWDIVSTLYDNK